MPGAELLSLRALAAFRDAQPAIVASAAEEFRTMLRSADAAVRQAEHLLEERRRELALARHELNEARRKLDSARDMRRRTEEGAHRERRQGTDTSEAVTSAVRRQTEAERAMAGAARRNNEKEAAARRAEVALNKVQSAARSYRVAVSEMHAELNGHFTEARRELDRRIELAMAYQAVTLGEATTSGGVPAGAAAATASEATGTGSPTVPETDPDGVTPSSPVPSKEAHPVKSPVPDDSGASVPSSPSGMRLLRIGGKEWKKVDGSREHRRNKSPQG